MVVGIRCAVEILAKAIDSFASMPAGATNAIAGSACTYYTLSLLSSLQFLYLAGRMNVANLPPNFRQVSDSLSWTVLNFRAPWESARGNTVSREQATTGFPSTPRGISTSSFGPRGASGLFSVSGTYIGRVQLHG